MLKIQIFLGGHAPRAVYGSCFLCYIIFLVTQYYACYKFYLSSIFIIKQTNSAPLTLSDPGYFRQLTVRGGALNPPPPYNLENYCVNLHHIIHVNLTRCFRYDPIGIFEKFAILTILQRFQNKK